MMKDVSGPCIILRNVFFLSSSGLSSDGCERPLFFHVFSQNICRPARMASSNRFGMTTRYDASWNSFLILYIPPPPQDLPPPRVIRHFSILATFSTSPLSHQWVHHSRFLRANQMSWEWVDEFRMSSWVENITVKKKNGLLLSLAVTLFPHRPPTHCHLNTLLFTIVIS